MFPNTSEVPFWAALKTASRDVLKVSGGFFVLNETVRYTLMGPFESSKTCSSLTFIRKLLGKFCCYTEISDDFLK